MMTKNSSGKKSTGTRIALWALGTVVGVLLLYLFIVLIPFWSEQKHIRLEAEALAELEMNKEADRQAAVNEARDTLSESGSEYNAVFLSMTESTGWSAAETSEAYIGESCYQSPAVYKDFDELYEAICLATPVDDAVLILDPVKLYRELEPETPEPGYEPKPWPFNTEEPPVYEPVFEKDYDFDGIFEDITGTTFRVFLPFYGEEYWNGYSSEEFERVLGWYRTVMSELLKYDRVILCAYTGDEWLATNSQNYTDPMTGDLKTQVFNKLFLYSYTDNHVITADRVKDVTDGIRKIYNKVAKEKAEEEYLIEQEREKLHWWNKNKEIVIEKDPLPMEGVDVIFMGDSIFANSDGPYSIASVVAEKTGARTYNISKGGMCTAYYPGFEDGGFNLTRAAEAFVNGRPTEDPDMIVFDTWLKKYLEDDHTDRVQYFVFDTCTNDYAAHNKIDGDDEYSVLYCYRKTMELIKEYNPDARFVIMLPYAMQFCNNLTVVNDLGYVGDDYYNAVWDEFCSEQAHDIQCALNLREEPGMDFSDGENAGLYLEDGTHPTPAGCYKVADELSNLLIVNYADIEAGY